MKVSHPTVKKDEELRREFAAYLGMRPPADGPNATPAPPDPSPGFVI